jgi:hypothetical protein
MDERKLVRDIIVINIMIVIISIFLWFIYSTNIGILITVISMWASFIVIRIIANRYGVTEYHLSDNVLIDRLLKKLVKW